MDVILTHLDPLDKLLPFVTERVYIVSWLDTKGDIQIARCQDRHRLHVMKRPQQLTMAGAVLTVSGAGPGCDEGRAWSHAECAAA